ncbi:MAG: phosphoglycolate phosphatase [Parvibaculum sp.]
MTVRPSILFDLDGTLADTARDLSATMNVLLAQHGRETLDISHVRHMVGAGARKIMERGFMLTGAPATEDELTTLLDAFLVYYSNHIADHTVLFPGVHDQLSRLADAGCLLAVCTNKPEQLSRQLLDALDITHLFPVVLGGDSLPVKKPDPLHLTEAISRLGGSPDAAIMVGDSATDIDAARAARLPSVCVSFGYTEIPPHELGADHLIDHFDALPEALARFLPDQASFFTR